MTQTEAFDGTPDELIAKVKESGKVVVVDFYTTWCPDCKRLDAQLPKFLKDFPSLKVIKINSEKHNEYVEIYSIRKVPTVKIFKNSGQEKPEIVGSFFECSAEDLRSTVEKAYQ